MPKKIPEIQPDELTQWAELIRVAAEAIGTTVIQYASAMSAIRIEEFKTTAIIALENAKIERQMTIDSIGDSIKFLEIRLEKVKELGVSIPQNVLDAIVVNNVLSATFSASVFKEYGEEGDDDLGVRAPNRYSLYKNALDFISPTKEEGA